jgi:hypothetical protein
MVAVRDSLIEQIVVCDRAIRRLAKEDETARRLVTVPVWDRLWRWPIWR